MRWPQRQVASHHRTKRGNNRRPSQGRLPRQHERKGRPYTADARVDRPGRNRHMAKLTQICASENDLFGLDADGVVYHYNFATNDWVRLGCGQRDRGGSHRGKGQPRSAQGEVLEGDGRADGEAVAGSPT